MVFILNKVNVKQAGERVKLLDCYSERGNSSTFAEESSSALVLFKTSLSSYFKWLMVFFPGRIIARGVTGEAAHVVHLDLSGRHTAERTGKNAKLCPWN